tara:strand:+ start:86 stop:289 length:204 start_codon:yes stop_codon:yes gene_type:complete
MQLASEPSDMYPHLLQRLIFDLKELKLINPIISNKIGTRNITNRILPIKLSIKFSPKKGIIIKNMEL